MNISILIYAFPTNPDTDPPLGGLVSKAQQQLLLEALQHRCSEEEFTRQLENREIREKRRRVLQRLWRNAITLGVTSY